MREGWGWHHVLFHLISTPTYMHHPEFQSVYVWVALNNKYCFKKPPFREG